MFTPEAPVIEHSVISRKFSVLIADDSRNDRFLLKKAIHSGAPSLNVVGETDDGLNTIAYLSGQEKYADRGQFPFPDLLFLDLKMPLVDGFEVLTWLRQRSFSELRVIVLTASLESSERQRIFDLGIKQAYLKPWRYQSLTNVLRTVVSDLATVSH